MYNTMDFVSDPGSPPPPEAYGQGQVFGQGQPIYYGSAAAFQGNTAGFTQQKLPFERRRQPVGILAVLICFAAPIALFAVVCATLTFSIRHTHAGITWLIVLVAAAATLACCALAAITTRNWFRGDDGRQPFWYIFLALSMVVAFGFAVWLGDLSWYSYTLPYYDIQMLSADTGVNVKSMPGTQLMDTGRVIFQEGTKIDKSKAIAFKNMERYCVAPIVIGDTPLEQYDYWAVGLDCCLGPGNYHCGEVDNPQAHAGLRLVREDQRGFYRLAVQQAQAAYKISANHPLFFYWMQDPVSELDKYLSEATKYYFFGLVAFSAAHLVMVVLGVFIFTKTTGSFRA